ncbi:MAG: tetratricopeptide repeat protein [Nannocystaceae bacterium]|nr:tetratricopeptide repeat protein [bacterium]
MANDTKRGLVFSTARLRLRAREHARVGDHAAAARALQRVIDCRPDDLEATLRLALHYIRSEQIVSAARTYLHAAEIYARLGQQGRALALFDRATQVDPLQATASRCAVWAMALGSEPAGRRLCSLAHLHRIQGRKDSALALLRLAADARPDDIPTLARLLDAEVRDGDREDVQVRLRATIETLQRRGRTVDQLRVAQLLLDRFPRNLFALRTLSLAFVAKGEAERALPLLLALQRREPGNADTLLRLARIHVGLGDRVQALAALERFVWVRASSGDRDAGEVIESVLTRAQSWAPGDRVWQRELIDLGFGAPTAPALDLGGAVLTVLPGTPPPPPLTMVPRDTPRSISIPRPRLTLPAQRRRAVASGELVVC